MVKQQDQRKDSKRVPFAEDDGVLCVVIKPDPSGGSFYLQALDVSENGIKFKTDPETDLPCSLWGTLLLLEIVGTRRVKFPEPIELVVKWQENEVDQCVFGCQIRRATPESKRQYVNFVRSEMKFGGMRPASPEIDPEEKEDEMAAWKKRIKSSSAPDQPHTRPWALVALCALLAILLVSVFYTCHQNRRLASRVEQMEERPAVVPVPSVDAEQVKNHLAAIDESLAVLKQLAQENRDTNQVLAGKVQTLEQQMTQAETRPDPGAAPPATEKEAPPQETAPKDDTAGSVHLVEKGENLYRISIQYNVALDRLAEINNMKVDDPIYPGQKIRLP